MANYTYCRLDSYLNISENVVAPCQSSCILLCLHSLEPETIVGPITFDLNFRVLRLLLTEREHVSLSILAYNFL